MSFDFFSKGLFLSYMNAGFSRKRPLQNKEVEGRGVLGIKGASERGGSKE